MCLNRVWLAASHVLCLPHLALQIQMDVADLCKTRHVQLRRGAHLLVI